MGIDREKKIILLNWLRRGFATWGELCEIFYFTPKEAGGENDRMVDINENNRKLILEWLKRGGYDDNDLIVFSVASGFADKGTPMEQEQ